jgi:membrane-associated phospholipid phosphatase
MKPATRNRTTASLFCLAFFTMIIVKPLNAADAIEGAGNVLEFALSAAAVSLALYNGDTKGLLQYGLSAGLTAGTTLGLKNSVLEWRPDHSDRLSFPSGHSSSTFAAAEFKRKRYGWEFGVPAYALATFTAFSRVEARKHFIHDVAAGAALGIISSYIFTKPLYGVKIMPVTDGRGIGVVVSGTF